MVALYGLHLSSISVPYAWLNTLMHSVHQLLNTVWWGMLIGVLMVGVLAKIPREFVMSVLGTNKSSLNSILRATAAGVLLDLCSHGILMVGAKLYERGANVGQIMAFLLASPWNSLSLTVILIALIGFWWTLAFIFLSALVAVFVGLIFDFLTRKNILPHNPHAVQIDSNFNFTEQCKKSLIATKFDLAFFYSMLQTGLSDSKIVVRWTLFGILLASIIRAFVSEANFETYFGPTILGLMFTIIAATIIEVCSEGATPIAADLLNRADAPGNSFAFLMAGVATDYTEIMVIRDTMRSWKIALFLPLITIPQVVIIAVLLNAT